MGKVAGVVKLPKELLMSVFIDDELLFFSSLV